MKQYYKHVNKIKNRPRRKWKKWIITILKRF
jgi:hypothetical protein